MVNIDKKGEVFRIIKSILKKSIINIKFIINSFLKKHRCTLCSSSRKLSLVFKGWPRYYLKCNGCNLIFVGNLPTNRSYRLLIQKEQSLSGYEARHKINWQDWQNWKIETYRSLGFFTFEETLRKTEKKLLEIGCTEGKQLEIFKRRGWDTLGIEPNKYFAHKCKILGLEVINGYFEDLMFPTQSFGLVITTHTLEHLKDPCIAVKKIFQVLKDNGRVILEVPLTIDYNHPEHLFFFSIKSLTKLLEDNYFHIIKTFRYQDKIFNHDNYAIIAEKSLESIDRIKR